MKKFKKSFFNSDNQTRHFDAFDVINLMLFIGSLALFVYALTRNTITLVNEGGKKEYIVPVVRMALGIIFVLLPSIFSAVSKRIFPRAITCLYYLFIFLSLYLGSYLGLYLTAPLYNRFIHALSGVIIAFFGMFFVRILNEKANPYLVFIIVFVFALSLGALWEIYEYAFDGLLSLNMQQAKELVGREALLDTILDLCCDAIGGIVAGAICAICSYKNANFINYFKLNKRKEENSIRDIIEE